MCPLSSGTAPWMAASATAYGSIVLASKVLRVLARIG